MERALSHTEREWWREGGVNLPGVVCSSYGAKLTALAEAVRWLDEEAEDWRTADLVTDSRSLVEALLRGGLERRLTMLSERLWRLEEGERRITLLCVPGHCGLEGNEEVDRLAGEGGRLDLEAVPVEAAARRALIGRSMGQELLKHERLSREYKGVMRENDEASLPSQNHVNFTRFRTGHHPSIGRWRALVGRTEDPTCRLYKMVRRGLDTFGWSVGPWRS